MSEMKKHTEILVLCDREEEYARLMTEYLKRRRDLPWEVHTYTDMEELIKGEKAEEVSLMVVAESTYQEELEELMPRGMVILNESGTVRWDQIKNIDKYQRAENVLRELLETYMEIVGETLPQLTICGQTKFVGMYSPIRRCLQTTFAITMSQMLAREHRTLYMNFEHYAGITELLPDMQTRDMADLLYFLTAQKDKFKLRLQAIIQKRGNLDYIPPMRSGQNLLGISGAEWLKLLQKIGEFGGYEYVVLDLTENMQGLFEILRQCVQVFTLTKNDRVAKCKLTQYEQILALYDYEDVLHKTKRCSLPQIRRLPEDMEQYTKSDLAEYVQAQIKEFAE
ncbi:MAG: hypothetical protein NC417_04590 [Candidatus Gastranaerophilales bacterium]|nr:hypothetical protein [Candidatus Gastranaerophilales bacterium]